MRERRSSGIQSYVWGLVLALVLTAFAFGVVHFSIASGTDALLLIAAAAALQVLVHLRWFVFADRTASQDQLLVLAFAVFLVIVMIGGSIWIMTDLAERMM